MRYGQIRQYDIANGPGIRATVFVTGCSRRCVNCFNEEYQDFNAGSEWTAAETERLISYLQDDTNSGLTLLGGEPMENAEDLLALVQAVRRAVPEKSIWVYSGFLYEEILAQPARKALLEARRTSGLSTWQKAAKPERPCSFGRMGDEVRGRKRKICKFMSLHFMGHYAILS